MTGGIWGERRPDQQPEMLQLKIMISHDHDRVRGWNFLGMIVISSSKNMLGWFKFWHKKLGLWMFHCVPHLFIHTFIFKNPKNYFSTIDQGFSIFERSVEAFDRFISFPNTSSSFHRSFPLFKSKNIKKISFDFNLLTFLPMDSTLTLHCSKFKSEFEELSINLFDT